MFLQQEAQEPRYKRELLELNPDVAAEHKPELLMKGNEKDSAIVDNVNMVNSLK